MKNEKSGSRPRLTAPSRSTYHDDRQLSVFFGLFWSLVRVFYFAFFTFLASPRPLLHAAHLHRQAEQVDEAARRGDVVVSHREARQLRVVERERRGGAHGGRTTPEQLHAHRAGHDLLRLVHQG